MAMNGRFSRRFSFAILSGPTRRVVSSSSWPWHENSKKTELTWLWWTTFRFAIIRDHRSVDWWWGEFLRGLWSRSLLVSKNTFANFPKEVILVAKIIVRNTRRKNKNAPLHSLYWLWTSEPFLPGTAVVTNLRELSWLGSAATREEGSQAVQFRC